MSDEKKSLNRQEKRLIDREVVRPAVSALVRGFMKSQGDKGLKHALTSAKDCLRDAIADVNEGVVPEIVEAAEANDVSERAESAMHEAAQVR